MRQSTIDCGGLHEVRRKERERDRHVDLAYAASFSLRYAFNIGICILDQLIEPAPSSRN
jgi:hypothetical protein